MFTGKTIGFIGAGNMGSAMIGGLVHGKVIPPEQVIAADLDEGRLARLKAKFGVQTTLDNHDAARRAHILVISVKPQDVTDILDSHDAAGCDFILSIAAGITIETLVHTFGNPRVVRSMPNTPAMVGQGMTVWTATPEVSQDLRDQAATILDSLGSQLFVAKEHLLDAATAVSGSGPAFVFLFMEALMDTAVHLGFSRDDAEKLVLQTVKGSVEYALSNGAHVAVLRNQVTSPAGTAAEALYHMEKGGLRHVIARGVWGAYQRSITLGGGKGRNPDIG